MSQVDNRNSFAGKRARTDGGRREDDWTCPSCGNVNFSFRTTCNKHNCTQSRPSDHSSKAAPRLQTPPHFQSAGGYVGSASHYGGAPYGSSFYSGSPLPPYDLPGGGSGYPYGYGGRISVGSPYGPHMSAPLPYSSGSMLGSGGIYGMPPLMDRYGMGMPMGHGPMGMPRPIVFPIDEFHKKPADAGRDNDWICPNCGNRNFAFRNVCNMRKCNTARPGNQGSKSDNFKGSKPQVQEGSWKCPKCNNINYPFRTKCNRQHCGAERPSESNEPHGLTSDEDEQVLPSAKKLCYSCIAPVLEKKSDQMCNKVVTTGDLAWASNSRTLENESIAERETSDGDDEEKSDQMCNKVVTTGDLAWAPNSRTLENESIAECETSDGDDEEKSDQMCNKVVTTGDLAWAPNSRTLENESIAEHETSDGDDDSQNLVSLSSGTRVDGTSSRPSTTSETTNEKKDKRKKSVERKRAMRSAMDDIVETSRIISRCMMDPPKIHISPALFTIPEALAELEKYPEVMNDFKFYDYVTMFFRDKRNRETFMSISKPLKLRWLRSRYTQNSQ